ncbi:MAG TPA: NAD-dependent epimerase/dehydratase family protein, partial [Chitinophagaceae bacterium]|nr:NAD-dependent epimerase/dehydratase family protein [Chitinophagaceae bacterium]
MKYNKILLAGGNGYLGTVLARYYSALAREVVILSRKAKPAAGNIRTIVWDGKTMGDWADELNNADLLVNLCGKNVNCRYTEQNKKDIVESRVVPTKLLGKAINELESPP